MSSNYEWKPNRRHPGAVTSEDAGLSVYARIEMRLRLLTLNIGGINNEWFAARGEAVRKGLQSLRPDLICLQEVAYWFNGHLHDQAADIGSAADLAYEAFSPYGNTEEPHCRRYGGLAILSHWPFSATRSFKLPSGETTGQDERVALVARILTPVAQVTVATTHLSWRLEEGPTRLKQMQWLLQNLNLNSLAPASSSPAVSDPSAIGPIVAGDLNASDEEPAIRLISRHLQDAFRLKHPHDPGFTWTNTNPWSGRYHMPDRRLDYIFCPNEGMRLKISAANVALNSPNPVYPSDHFGLCADIELLP
jgi:endonuclease/exonuclease/phosphatase family metal-dependent hydrolase